MRLSVERAACRPSTPRVSTGNPGERSGEICGSSGPFLEMFFDSPDFEMAYTKRDLP
jgi:hypothetical protein